MLTYAQLSSEMVRLRFFLNTCNIYTLHTCRWRLLFLLPLIVLPIVIVLLIVLAPDDEGFKAVLAAHVPWFVMTACSNLFLSCTCWYQGGVETLRRHCRSGSGGA